MDERTMPMNKDILLGVNDAQLINCSGKVVGFQRPHKALSNTTFSKMVEQEMNFHLSGHAAFYLFSFGISV